MSEGFVAGVDIGATRIRVGLVSPDGRLLAVKTSATPRVGNELTIADRVASLIRDLAAEAGGRPTAVGVGTVGPLDIRRGNVVGSPNVGLRSFKVREPLREALGVEVYVVNDCVAAAWGEYTIGAGRGRDNVVYLTLSTGIGCGAVVNGHLLLGKDGNAHEIGHIVLDTSGRFLCGCGAPGHWEGIASGANIPKTARILASEWRGPRTKAFEEALRGSLRPEDLYAYWRLGDDFAGHTIDFLSEVNAAGLASAVNVYDPEVLTLGGAIALGNPDFVELMLRKLRKYLVNRPPDILLSPLGEHAVLLGAAMVALRTPPELLRMCERPRVSGLGPSCAR